MKWLFKIGRAKKNTIHLTKEVIEDKNIKYTKIITGDS